MPTSKSLITLSWIVATLALTATCTALLWPGSQGSYAFTSLRGETVEIYGRGLYQYDSLLIGAGFRGADLVILFLALPLLVYSIKRYRRGSLRGAFLLLGTLAFFLYNYASMALGAAYNGLFVIYVALFSTSFFATVLAFRSIDQTHLPSHVSSQMPHRALIIFLFATGFVFCVVWLGLGILLPLSQGETPPELASYTTLVTHVLDLGILMPTAILAGLLLHRRAPVGYLLSFVVLVIGIFVVALSVPAATVSQWLAGYAFTSGQFIAFVASFFVLGLIALWLALLFLRNIEEA